MPWVFVLIWSTGFIVARFGMPHSPPLSFLCLRYGLSCLAFGLWVRWSRAAWPTDARQVGHLLVCGVLIHAGYLGGVWSAVKAGMGAGTVALLVGLQPVLTAVWLARSAGGPAAGSGAGAGSRGLAIGARQWAGLSLGFTGLLMVVWPKLGVGEASPHNLALATLALLSITIGTLYQKRHVAPCDARTAGLVQMVGALAVSLPLALLEAEAIDWHPEFIGALAWSVLGLTLGGSSLLYLLIQRGAATQVTSLLFLVPPTTALMAWPLFGETMGPLGLAGMAITAVGVALVVRAPAAPAAPVDPAGA